MPGPSPTPLPPRPPDMEVPPGLELGTRTCCFGNYMEDNRLTETIPILIESLNTLCMIWEDYIAIHKPEFQFKLDGYDFLSIS